MILNNSFTTSINFLFFVRFALTYFRDKQATEPPSLFLGLVVILEQFINKFLLDSHRIFLVLEIVFSLPPLNLNIANVLVSLLGVEAIHDSPEKLPLWQALILSPRIWQMSCKVREILDSLWVAFFHA